MFIPTKSDGQISVNLRNIPTKSDGQISVNLRKIKEKKKEYIFFSPSQISFRTPGRFVVLPFVCFLFCLLFFSFSLSGTHMSHFLPFSVRFSPETIYFVSISISFILIEYSLNICHFSEFFKNPVFRFHSISAA